MKARKFAQFYQLSTGYISGTIPPKFDCAHVTPIPACGSDSVYLFDGRKKVENCLEEVRYICQYRNYIGFTIEQGSFLNPQTIRPLELIEGTKA